MQLFLEGLILGAPAILFVGPVLFTLLQASIRHDFRAGFAVASGIAFSDVVCIALCYLGVAQFLTKPTNQTILSVVGGLILIGFGISSLLFRHKEATTELKGRQFATLFGQGFLVNFANPVVFTYWIGALGLVASRHKLTPMNVTLVFAGAVTTIYVTDTLKALFAHKLKHLIKSTALVWLNRALGVCFFGAGFYLFWRAWTT